MSWIAAAIVGSNVVSGILGSNASQNAAQLQSNAANNATANQLAMFNTINNQNAPGRATGYNALNQIGALNNGQYTQYDANGNPIGTATGSGYLTNQFNNQDLNANLAPNYAFQLQQGQNATNQANNATGGMVSGNALKGLQDYTQGAAGSAYQQAFNNYTAQRTGIYNTLASIAGLGQTANAQSAQAGTNYANAASQLGVGSAAAQAAGQIGSTQALTGGITGASNGYLLSQLLSPNTGQNYAGYGGASSVGNLNIPTVGTTNE